MMYIECARETNCNNRGRGEADCVAVFDDEGRGGEEAGARFPDTDSYSSVHLDCDRGSLSAMTSYILKYA
eukprot:scaffold486_cov148-Skeletonema_dohrnii-CCMP3373.AAC.24